MFVFWCWAVDLPLSLSLGIDVEFQNRVPLLFLSEFNLALVHNLDHLEWTVNRDLLVMADLCIMLEVVHEVG